MKNQFARFWQKLGHTIYTYFPLTDLILHVIFPNPALLASTVNRWSSLLRSTALWIEGNWQSFACDNVPWLFVQQCSWGRSSFTYRTGCVRLYMYRCERYILAVEFNWNGVLTTIVWSEINFVNTVAIVDNSVSSGFTIRSLCKKQYYYTTVTNNALISMFTGVLTIIWTSGVPTPACEASMVNSVGIEA